MFPFNWKLIAQYCAACEVNGRMPTWEGADVYRSMMAKQKPENHNSPVTKEVPPQSATNVIDFYNFCKRSA